MKSTNHWAELVVFLATQVLAQQYASKNHHNKKAKMEEHAADSTFHLNLLSNRQKYKGEGQNILMLVQ